MRRIATILAAMVLTSCGGNDKKEEPPRAYPAEVPATAEYVIGYGETLFVQGGLALQFTTLAEDSRCPLNVDCIWAGNARILMTATFTDSSGHESSRVVELNTNSQFPVASQIDASYSVQLRKLEPYPGAEAQTRAVSIPVSSYEATVFVDRVMTHHTTQGPQ